MSIADTSITSVNHAAQGTSAEIFSACREYVAAREQGEAAKSDEEISQAGECVSAAVAKLSAIPAQSAADLRAKFAVFDAEASDEITDHNGIELFNGINADLEALHNATPETPSLVQRVYSEWAATATAAHDGSNPQGVDDVEVANRAYDHLMSLGAGNVADVAAKFRAMSRMWSIGVLQDHPEEVAGVLSIMNDLNTLEAASRSPRTYCNHAVLIRLAADQCPAVGEDLSDFGPLENIVATALRKRATSLDGALFLLGTAYLQAEDVIRDAMTKKDAEVNAANIQSAIRGAVNALWLAGARLPENVAEWFLPSHLVKREG